MIVDPPGELKISEVLLRFVEPYKRFWGDEKRMNSLLGLALIAWNASLLPINARAEFVDKMLRNISSDLQADVRSMIDEMIQRKNKDFADIRRAIIDFKSVMTGSRLTVSVTSSLPLP